MVGAAWVTNANLNEWARRSGLAGALARPEQPHGLAGPRRLHHWHQRVLVELGPLGNPGRAFEPQEGDGAGRLRVPPHGKRFITSMATCAVGDPNFDVKGNLGALRLVSPEDLTRIELALPMPYE